MELEKKVIQCEKCPITYTLVRKQVKNINMRISNKGEVIVSANPLVSLEKIDDFVKRKSSWILKHQTEAISKNEKCLLDENNIMLFGKPLKIKYTVGKYNYVSYDDKHLYVQYRDTSQPQKVIHQFLDKLCKDVYTDIVKLTCRTLREYQIVLPTIKVRDMKSKWGSCIPAKQTITLNRKLIHYPLEFMEYVILHEMVHFVQPDHSKKFYHIIEGFMPDYKERIKLID